MEMCKIVRGGEQFRGKQGLEYFSGISAESAGSKAICMHLLVMPPGAESKPHYHAAHETAIYMLEGAAEFRHGPKLEHHDRVKAGDFIYIPAGVPHQPFNPTGRVAKASSRGAIPTSRKASSSCPDFPGKTGTCPIIHNDAIRLDFP